LAKGARHDAAALTLRQQRPGIRSGMTLLLSGQSLSKSFGERPLFTEISIELVEGQRLGLIGPNGSGKSTLLRILAGEELPDAGVRSLRKGARLGYVPQLDQFDPEQSVEQVLLAALEGSGLDAGQRHTRATSMLARLGFANHDARAGTLSGGWRKRLAIGRQLILEPDVLLLDEPTNHLDLEGIVWLERLLTASRFAVLLVSHDRYFLQNVTRRVVEINRCYPKGYFTVEGNYADFLAKREELLAGQAQQQSVLANKVRREIEWLKRGPAARTTKSASRIKRAGDLQDQLAEVSFRNNQNRAVDIDFSATGRKANQLLVAKGLAKSRGGRKLFKSVELTLAPGIKIGLLGKNGSGKSTLLKLLSGELQPDEGTIERAIGLRSVLFDQARQQLDPDQSLRDALAPDGENVKYQGRSTHVVAWAKRFLFTTEQLARPVGGLSGGEQARVLIARLMLEPADLLLLDEPTNDLDIASLEVLEESLLEFPGAMVLVTHDRYLLDRVTNVIVALDDQGGVRSFADLAQWQAAQDAAAEAAGPTAVPAKRPAEKPPAAGKRMNYQERRELEGMEAKIAECEQSIAEREAQLMDPAIMSDYVRLAEVSEQLRAAQAELESLFARWEELDARQTPK